MRLLNKLWWALVPGTVVKVRWPVGRVVVTPSSKNWDWTLGATRQEIESADPNDHYRPWLEANVGRQTWDWDWNMLDNDSSTNRLSIKVRRAKSKYATEMALRWT